LIYSIAEISLLNLKGEKSILRRKENSEVKNGGIFLLRKREDIPLFAYSHHRKKVSIKISHKFCRA